MPCVGRQQERVLQIDCSRIVKRHHTRCFIIVAILAITIQSIPGSLGSDDTTNVATRLLNRIGLWQRPWTLFAPNPKTQVVWLSAEIRQRDGEISRWSSTDWTQASVIDKFLGFRQLNFDHRFEKPLIQPVTADLTDYLRRQSPSPTSVESIELSLNTLELIVPEDGNIPARDDRMLILSVKPLGKRSYD